MTGYAAFASRIQGTGVLADPWLEGEARFRAKPVVLDEVRYRDLAAAAAAIAAVHEELAQIVARDPDLLDSFFGLTPWQRGMWQCSAPDWHGIARADVFMTADGAKVCELNSDTPSGEAEAVLLSALIASEHPGLIDLNAGLPRRFVAMCEAWARTVGRDGPLTVGLLYPTELTEDLSMVAVYRGWLEQAGHRVVLGSPFNLGLATDGRATLFDVPCDVVVRHYKTDWWGERLPVFDDEAPFDDREPLVQPLLTLLQASVQRTTAVVNPFGAVLTQNKRAMAFCWERIDRFSATAQAAIRRFLPRTVRLELAREDLWQQRERWVLKSDYGCEGAEVIVGKDVDQASWEGTLAHAIATRWVAQSYFAAESDPHGDVTNHGVYVIGGQAAGVLARVHAAAVTDDAARIAPVLLRAARRTEGAA